MSSKPETDFTIYSDGGSNSHQNAASACILQSNKTKRRLYLGAYFGVGTNNEAEIFALLLGLSALRLKLGPERKFSLLWISDSEYSLKSASSYIKNWLKNGWRTADKSKVKNQGLWKFFLELSSQIHLHTQHVKGHSGHVENEVCDEIVNELKDFAESSESSNFSFGKRQIDSRAGTLSVNCFNATSWLNELRDEEPSASIFEAILGEMEQCLGSKSSQTSPAIRPGQEPPPSSKPEKNSQKLKSEKLRQLRLALSTAISLLQDLESLEESSE